MVVLLLLYAKEKNKNCYIKQLVVLYVSTAGVKCTIKFIWFPVSNGVFHSILNHFQNTKRKKEREKNIKLVRTEDRKTKHKVGKCFEVILNQIIQLNWICMFLKRFFFSKNIPNAPTYRNAIGFCFLKNNNAMAKNIGFIHCLSCLFYLTVAEIIIFPIGSTQNREWNRLNACPCGTTFCCFEHEQRRFVQTNENIIVSRQQPEYIIQYSVHSFFNNNLKFFYLETDERSNPQ